MTKPAPDREREVLLEWLEDQRGHVPGVLRGLPEESLRRPVLPSGGSCLAPVRHLAVDVERFWFRGVAAGEAVDLTETKEIANPPRRHRISVQHPRTSRSPPNHQDWGQIPNYR
jgi:hypothetical protein